ncbi:MAG TPA: isochorismatase family protein [Thermoleophilaceae bacterium]|nr:isochorismatase family protein [Thermoleophilaceae bacterium]
MEASGRSSALLVVDVQRSVMEGCADAQGVVERINGLARRAAEAGAAVIFIQHRDEDGELVEGSPGWELAEELEPPDGSEVVPKSYRDSFEQTDLEARLKERGVRRLVVTGAHSDFCVQTTALSALVRGFDLVLVSDGHTTVPSAEGPELPGEALTALINARMATLRYPGRTVEVLPAADVEMRLRQASAR